MLLLVSACEECKRWKTDRERKKERKKNREREKVCMCECEGETRWLHVNHWGETRRDGVVCDGPVWVQWRGCGFVTGMMLEARGDKHTNAKRRGEQSLF